MRHPDANQPRDALLPRRCARQSRGRACEKSPDAGQAGGRALGKIAQARDAAEAEAEVHDEAAERGGMRCNDAATTLRRRCNAVLECGALQCVQHSSLRYIHN